MHKSAFFFTLTSLYLVSGLLSVFARIGAAPETLRRVPNDSVIVLSVDGAKVIAKSGILQSNSWKPLLDLMEKSGSPIRKWFADSNISGISWEDPLQFFVRLIEGERPYPQFGAILRTSSVNKPTRLSVLLPSFSGFAHPKTIPRCISVRPNHLQLDARVNSASFWALSFSPTKCKFLLRRMI